MPDVTVDRRSSPRYPIVLSSEVTELPSGAKLRARTSDLSSHGCYLDMLNPLPNGSKARLSLLHGSELFETLITVVYTSPGLGMGVHFEEVPPEKQKMLDRWIAEYASTHD